MVDLRNILGIGAIAQLVELNDGLSDIMDSMPFCITIIDEEDKVIFKTSTENSFYGFDFFDAVYEVNPQFLRFRPNVEHKQFYDNGLSSKKHFEHKVYLPEKDIWLSCDMFETQMESTEGKKINICMIHDVTSDKKNKDKLCDTVKRLTRLADAGIESIGKIVEHRDPYTSMHQKNTGIYAHLIAKKLGYDGERLQQIRYAGMVQDVGKTSIPVMILNKPGKLTNFEYDTVKHHVEASYDILKGISHEIPIADMVLQHHERLDGSGYPNGLKKDEISQEGRILAVADVLDAMTSHRPYRPKRSFEQAIAHLKDNSGTLYDIKTVLAVYELYRDNKFQEARCEEVW